VDEVETFLNEYVFSVYQFKKCRCLITLLPFSIFVFFVFFVFFHQQQTHLLMAVAHEVFEFIGKRQLFYNLMIAGVLDKPLSLEQVHTHFNQQYFENAVDVPPVESRTLHKGQQKEVCQLRKLLYVIVEEDLELAGGETRFDDLQFSEIYAY